MKRIARIISQSLMVAFRDKTFLKVFLILLLPIILVAFFSQPKKGVHQIPVVQGVHLIEIKVKETPLTVKKEEPQTSLIKVDPCLEKWKLVASFSSTGDYLRAINFLKMLNNYTISGVCKFEETLIVKKMKELRQKFVRKSLLEAKNSFAKGNYHSAEVSLILVDSYMEKVDEKEFQEIFQKIQKALYLEALRDGATLFEEADCNKIRNWLYNTGEYAREAGIIKPKALIIFQEKFKTSCANK